MADAPVLTGLLLAGGGSRRMGRDKTAPDFLIGGEPLAARVARALGEVCDEVLVASGDGKRMAWLGLPQVADALPDSGPLGGLVAGLEAATHPHVAVVAADMPFASPALLCLLASLVGGHDAAVPVSPDGTEPLHAVYARSALGVLRGGPPRGAAGGPRRPGGARRSRGHRGRMAAGRPGRPFRGEREPSGGPRALCGTPAAKLA